MLRQRRPRPKKDKARREYLAYIASLPCVISGQEPVEVAHVRYGDPEYDKRETGMGERPDDYWSLPLCPDLHRIGREAQHCHGERAWWQARGIDPLWLCQQLRAIFEQTPKDRRETEARAQIAAARFLGSRR